MSTLKSERVVIASPMSFAGSKDRIWNLVNSTDNTWVRWLLVIPFAVGMIGMAWGLVALWYLMFGILVIPWRILRRGQRKDKKAQTQHRETLEAIKYQSK